MRLFSALLACLLVAPLGASDLHDAAARGDLQAAEKLLQCFFCRRINVEERDSSGWTALMRAAAGGHVKLVQLLLDHRADVNARTPRGRDSALAFAILRGQTGAAVLLLQSGADANTAGLLGPPLSLAVRNKDAAAVRALIARGVDVNRRPSVLFDAAEAGHPEIIRLLLEAGADPDVRGPAGTPLLAAVRAGNLDAVRELLRGRADPGASVPPRGFHSLAAAAESGRADLIRLLAASGAHVDRRYYYLREETGDLKAFRECTALMAAARSGSAEAVRALLDAGADATLKDDAGHDALWHALDSRRRDTEKLLRTHLQSLRKR